MHGSLVTSSLIRETTENESANEGYRFGHLVWATGFMFLISWRGYWQELIETLACNNKERN
jgi:hypothetical protein